MYYPDYLGNLPIYVIEKKIPCKWGPPKSLIVKYRELQHQLQQIRENGWSHMMESPTRFISDYNRFTRKLYLVLVFRKTVCNWWVKKKFLEMYEEIKFRPGNSGYQNALTQFSSLQSAHNETSQASESS